jgi:cytochrome oxidase Cu insertion factor (SCO1/SenC/PrrC family)
MSGFWLMGLILAELLPPAQPGLVPRSLAVLDEQDRHQNFATVGEATLLVPIFTRCGGSCPLTAVALKQAMRGASVDFRVVLLSFDPRDSGADLRNFRERLGLPLEWLLVRSVDAAASRQLLDSLDFQVMNTGPGFNHPDQTFVFSPKGLWAATLSGPPSTEELKSAHRRALAADDRTAGQRLDAWLIRPEAWIVLACAGFGFSFAAILLLARRGRAGSAPGKLSRTVLRSHGPESRRST